MPWLPHTVPYFPKPLLFVSLGSGQGEEHILPDPFSKGKKQGSLQHQAEGQSSCDHYRAQSQDAQCIHLVWELSHRISRKLKVENQWECTQHSLRLQLPLILEKGAKLDHLLHQILLLLKLSNLMLCQVRDGCREGMLA